MKIDSLSGVSDVVKIWLRKCRAMILPSRQQRRLKRARKNLDRPVSVFFFTTHKCASTFVSGPLFRQILKNSNYQYEDYAAAIWRSGDELDLGGSYESLLSSAYSDLYSLRGSVYGPQRRYLDFPGRNNFRHIFFLRDPRDVLVSSYFSEAYTHPVPASAAGRDRLDQSRKETKNLELDDYVLAKAESWIQPLYNEYQTLRESADDSLYLTYDQFIDNTKGFLARLCDFLDVEPGAETIKRLARVADPVQNTEVLKHKRSGKSGQYIERLYPETVQKLDRILASELRYWDFNVEMLDTTHEN
jgi:hypothetical protein